MIETFAANSLFIIKPVKTIKTFSQMYIVKPDILRREEASVLVKV